MGTGWRRAFCTSIRRDPETTATASEKQQSSSPSSYAKLGILSGGGSNPSTPRLLLQSTPRCRSPTSPPSDSPKLQCKTASAAVTTTSSTTSKGSPRLLQTCPNPPSSPRSPSRFALFKTAFRLSRNRCGICAQSVRTRGQRTAVFTAECSHVFHFPCISSHVRSQGCLVCPVCSSAWHEVPLLSSSVHTLRHDDLLGKWGDRLLAEENRGPPPPNEKRGRREGDGSTKAARATKVYNDDESLLPSPTSRGGGVLQFNPIPEADDEDDNDPQEEEEGCGGFDGLSSNTENYSPSALSPSSSSSSSRCTAALMDRGGGGCSDVEVSVMPEAAALVSIGRSHQSYVVAIKVKAPPRPPRAAAASNNKHHSSAAAALPPTLLEPSCRAPIDLVSVLDVSGSMTVEKLQMLKRAMRLVISSLWPGDRLSIVAFSTAAAKRLLPLRRMSRDGQRSARQIVDRLVVCGGSLGQGQSHHCSSSCVGDALRKATKVLEDRRERNPVSTIMLLSDGNGQQQQQAGYQQQHFSRGTTTSYRSHPSSATRFTHLEIPIHASGFGDAAAAPPPPHPPQLNQQQKQRRSHNTPVVEDAFAKCVNGLVSVVLQDVHLQFIFPSGAISSVYSYGGGGGIGRAVAHGEGGKSVRLGDLYAVEERELLVELRVPKAAVVGGGTHHYHSMPMAVKCSYRDPVSREVIQCGERPLVMPPLLHFQDRKNQNQSQSHYHPTVLRSSSSSSSPPTTSALSMTAMKMNSQEEQQRLRNLFVTTRAMAESRRLVDLNDLDTAVHLLSSARSLLLQQSTSISSHKNLVLSLEAELADLQRQRRQQQQQQSLSPSQRRSEQALMLAEARGGGGGGEPLTPTSAWRAAEQLAKVAIMRKSLNRVSDLHGLENARF